MSKYTPSETAGALDNVEASLIELRDELAKLTSAIHAAFGTTPETVAEAIKRDVAAARGKAGGA